MSMKRQLAEAIAEMPDSLTLEEAVERLYRAFKLKQARTGVPAPLTKREQLLALYGSLADDPLERPSQGAFEVREPIP